METVQFSAEISTATYTSPSTVSNTETDAIVLLPLDANQSPLAVAEVGANTQATLYINFTQGSLTNCKIRFYGSPLRIPTASDWYQEVIESDSSGDATLIPFDILMTADTKVAYQLPIGAYRSFKITTQSTGTVTGSSITLTLGMRSN